MQRRICSCRHAAAAASGAAAKLSPGFWPAEGWGLKVWGDDAKRWRRPGRTELNRESKFEYHSFIVVSLNTTHLWW
jgi:hypothetical protein